MTAYSVQHQDKNVINDFVYKQPVGVYVAFSAALIVVAEIIIAVFFLQEARHLPIFQ